MYMLSSRQLARHAMLEAAYLTMHVCHMEPWLLQLRIEGEGLRHVELSLHDLKTKFKRHSVAAAMQCSGNRRHDMIEVKKIQGLDWDIGECTDKEQLDMQISFSVTGKPRQRCITCNLSALYCM